MGQGGWRKWNDKACAAHEMSGPPITLVSEGSRTAFPVTAAVGVRRPLPQNSGFGSGRSRGQDPSHKTQAQAAGRARFLWERPWPRCGRCNLQALIQAAVGVRRPLPQSPGSGHSSGAIPVGAALAATRPLQSAGFDAGRSLGQDPSHRAPVRAPAAGRARSPLERPWPRRGRSNPPASMRAATGVKTPATEPWPGLRPQVGRDLRGSGLGRDAAAAIRRLRCRLQSGPRPLPQNTALPRQNRSHNAPTPGISPTYFHGPRLRSAPDAAGLV